MKKLLLLSTLCLGFAAHAQRLAFPAKDHGDSLSLVNSMPGLAKQVIGEYSEEDKFTYFDNRYRLFLVAGNYRAALDNLDSARRFLRQTDPLAAGTAGVAYQVFAKAKIDEARRSIPFDSAIALAFTDLSLALPEKDMLKALGSFLFEIKDIHDDLNTQLQKLKAQDSISLSGARQLCRAYLSYIVYSRIAPATRPLATELQRRKFIIEDSVLVTTRDGASLALHLVRRRDIADRQPAIFVFNIYSGFWDKRTAIDAATNGYVGVVANTRGKRLSPQVIEPFEHDANDAYDIIDWISKQPWSNGRVGMYGGSYLGFAQWAAAKKVHPALKTIVPQVAVGIGVDYPMMNNIFMGYMLQWIHYVTNSKETDDADFNNDDHWDSTYTRWYVSGRSFRSLDSIEGRPNVIFQRWLKHPAQDAYWQHMVAYQSDFAQVSIPILTITGYFDADQRGAMYYFNQHLLYNKHAQHYLVIGPYDHGGAQISPRRVLRGYTIDSVASMSMLKLVYDWFDYVLRDSARPALLSDKINYEVMGANKWRHAPSLPAMNNDTLRFYLSNVRVAAHYKLAVTPPSSPEFIRQEIDFKDRSDSSQKASWKIVDSTFDTSNGISFISSPFDRPMEINGSFLSDLKASINKKDMDIAVSLYELMPNGKFFALSNGIGRASYATSREQRQLLQPGRIESIPLANTYFVSRRIAAGSRIVVELGIIKDPNWQINYGTGRDVSDETITDAGTPLEIKWYTNSMIQIPVRRPKN